MTKQLEAELVETVARAMKPELFELSDDKVGPVTTDERGVARNMARRAITAMRSATPQAEDGLLRQLLNEAAAHDHRRTADGLDAVREKVGRDGLTVDGWNALIGAASHLRVEADRRELAALAPQVAAPACPRCGKPPSEHSVVDYTVVCKPGVTDLKDEDDGR